MQCQEGFQNGLNCSCTHQFPTRRLSNAMMSVEELGQCLNQYGYYVRERSTIDESLPNAKWIVVEPLSGNKQGCSNRLQLATIVLRIERRVGTR